MFCKNCGNELKDGLKFCPKCGSPVMPERQPEEVVYARPEGEKKRNMNISSIILGVLAAALAVILVLQNLSILPSLSGSRGAISSDVGYSTPEETAQALADAIAANDLDAAISLFACNQMAENYDYAAMMEMYQSWYPGMAMPFSSEDTLYTDINKKFLERNAASQIAYMMFSLEGETEYMEGNVIRPDDGDVSEMISDMQSACDLDNLSSFSLERMGLANLELQLSESAQESWERQCEIYGADERAEYIVQYSYNGNSYIGGMSLYRYGEDWYIQSLSATIAGQNSFGYLAPADEEEYLELTGGQ